MPLPQVGAGAVAAARSVRPVALRQGHAVGLESLTEAGERAVAVLGSVAPTDEGVEVLRDRGEGRLSVGGHAAVVGFGGRGGRPRSYGNLKLRQGRWCSRAGRGHRGRGGRGRVADPAPELLERAGRVLGVEHGGVPCHGGEFGQAPAGELGLAESPPRARPEGELACGAATVRVAGRGNQGAPCASVEGQDQPVRHLGVAAAADPGRPQWPASGADGA